MALSCALALRLLLMTHRSGDPVALIQGNDVLKERYTLMNKFALLMPFVFVAGVAMAQDSTSTTKTTTTKTEEKKADTPAVNSTTTETKTNTEVTKANGSVVKGSSESKSTHKSAVNKPAAGKVHAVKNAEVTAVDADKKTISIKMGADEKKDVPVEGKALASLKTVKTGEMVDLMCRDNAAGEHQAVTSIHKAAPVKAKAKVEKPAADKK